MKLKLLAIAALSLTILGSCGNKSASTSATDTAAPVITEEAVMEDEPESDGTVEFNAGGPVEYVNNATITPDATLVTIIDFNATWCGPCQRFAPIFEEVAKEMKGKAKFVSVDVDNSPVAAQQFNVQSIPQITVLKPDGTYKSTIGFMEKDQFIKFLNEAMK